MPTILIKTETSIENVISGDLVEFMGVKKAKCTKELCTSLF